jgi:CO/xanthine dehydrogenase Mo-binding subunit
MMDDSTTKRANTKNKDLTPRDISRPDALDKVRGEARFVDDLAFPGMLHAAVVRSTVPHARIVKLGLAPALEERAVVCTLTADEIPGENVVHVIYDDQPALAAGVVRYVGEPIALVAAEDRTSAREAAAGVKIEYEEIPAVFDPIEALSPDAPAVALPKAVEERPNLFNAMRVRKGDVEQGIVEGEYRTGYQEHAYLETQGAIAVPEENGAMAIYGTMQCPFYVQGAVARVLGLPLSKVRVVQTTTGGAFGGKEDVPSLVSSLAALLAWKARRPVKLVFDRTEDILTSSKRHPAIVHYRSGAKNDGTLTAIEVDFVYNAGAYQTLSSAVLWRGLILADKLGIDRLEIRRRNALVVGDETSTEQRLDESVGLLETIEAASRLAHWEEKLRKVEEFNARERDRRRGLGISSVIYGVGLGGKAPFLDKAGAYMKLEADGSIGLAVGTVEMGQGLITALTQIASEALSVPVDRIHIAQVDSSRVPDSGPTVASRGTMMSGLAILDAATKLKERIHSVAQDMGIPKEEIPVRLQEIAQAFWMRNLDPAVEGWAKAAPVDWDPKTGLGNAYTVYAYATHIAEVEVDLVTGEVSVEEFSAVHDSGKILNRRLAVGQVEGGIAQGLGFALMEEIPEKDGHLMTTGFTTYRIPTIRDVAPNIEVDFVEAIYSKGPFGAKGLGEVPLMAAHTAVSRAVAHAIEREVVTYPLSPERVKELVKH